MSDRCHATSRPVHVWFAVNGCSDEDLDCRDRGTVNPIESQTNPQAGKKILLWRFFY